MDFCSTLLINFCLLPLTPLCAHPCFIFFTNNNLEFNQTALSSLQPNIFHLLNCYDKSFNVKERFLDYQLKVFSNSKFNADLDPTVNNLPDQLQSHF